MGEMGLGRIMNVLELYTARGVCRMQWMRRQPKTLHPQPLLDRCYRLKGAIEVWASSPMVSEYI